MRGRESTGGAEPKCCDSIRAHSINGGFRTGGPPGYVRFSRQC